MAAMDAVSGKTSSGVGSKRGRMSDFYGAEGSVARREADDAICLYFAALGVPENQADNPLFRNMIRAVAAAGGSYVPPKRKYVGGAGLQRTRKRIEEGLDPVVKKWPEKGVIASDMMSDRNGRAQANFLCVNEDGAVFMESVDCGMERKTGGYIASLIRPVITKVGPENVVALCMDGASNYAAATREIVKEWPHIEIVPCATHVLDLFMEDIGKMDWAKKLVERAGELITFLRNHHWTRAYLRAGELHGEKVLQALRPAGTRFGTQYLAMSRLCELRPHLSSMVSHDVFKDWAAAAGAKVKEAGDKFEKYVLDSAWWKTAEFFKKLLQLPYVTMRKTDSTKKGMMANMYDLMLQLTEEMSALLEEDEEQLSDEDKEKISDFMKARWDDSLACALHVAGRIFNPANQKEGIFLRDRECTKDWAAAAGAKVKEAGDKFEKYVLDSAWWKTAEFFKKLLQLPYVTMRKTDSTKKGMMANMYDLMLQLTEEMSALLEEDEEQLSDEDKEKISDFMKARWDDSLACALHVAGRIFNPANQKEGIFLRDRECTK
ncbi:unnamed protein product, partial [Closterium sp. NIES-53]